jgi:hypothetical protein
MAGNNRLADSGSICIGCHCLILPPVPPGATRGLRAAADTAGIPLARVTRYRNTLPPNDCSPERLLSRTTARRQSLSAALVCRA